jgi:hypothetical protein
MSDTFQAAPPLETSTPKSDSSSDQTSMDKEGIELPELKKGARVDVAPVDLKVYRRLAPRFMLGRELARGAMQIVQSFLGYMLMLAFMMAK